MCYCYVTVVSGVKLHPV